MTKGFLSSFALFYLTFHSASAMEYPQLQLENPQKDQLISVNCDVMLHAQTQPNIGEKNPIKYATKNYHNRIFQVHNLQSSIKDPVLQLDVIYKSETRWIHLPLKYCMNLNDNSMLQIIDLNPHFPDLHKKTILINATCKKNPELPGNTFAQQINLFTKQFYIRPGKLIQRGRCELSYAYQEETLIEAKIIKHSTLLYRDEIRHGKNGCSNAKKLEQSAIEEKIPQKISYVKTLRQRELTGSFK